MLPPVFIIRQDAEVTDNELDAADDTSFAAGDLFEDKMLSDFTWLDAEVPEGNDNGKELELGDLFTEVVLVAFIWHTVEVAEEDNNTAFTSGDLSTDFIC